MMCPLNIIPVNLVLVLPCPKLAMFGVMMPMINGISLNPSSAMPLGRRHGEELSDAVRQIRDDRITV